MGTKYPFKNLVFKGGGVKAFAYHGVIEIMEEMDILPQIERVAGTSAGALIAGLLSFRLSARETIALMKTLDFSKIAASRIEAKNIDGDQISDRKTSGFDRFLGGLDTLRRFINHYGMRSYTPFHNWIKQTIGLLTNGKQNASFSDLKEQECRDLYIVAANLSTKRETIFSYETTPDVAVADAILLSSSLPIFFEAPLFDGKNLGEGDYYIDGGVLANYPIHIFDDMRYVGFSKHFRHGINWETLGCRLFTPPECPEEDGSINHILGFFENLFDMYARGQEIGVEGSLVNQLRSINISNCCMSTTDFEIIPNPENEKYRQLTESGRQATLEFLEDYILPVDKFYKLKAAWLEANKKLTGWLKL
ncbi:MAG: patatin-like phospholipase family protein [Anaerolineales bacterium]